MLIPGMFFKRNMMPRPYVGPRRSVGARLLHPNASGEDTSPSSCAHGQQLGQPNQIEGRTREYEQPVDVGQAAQLHLANPGDGLQLAAPSDRLVQQAAPVLRKDRGIPDRVVR